MKVHQTDIEHLEKIRASVDDLVRRAAEAHDVPDVSVLDIGPDDAGTVKKYFQRATVRTLNMLPPADIVADLSEGLLGWEIIQRKFDVVVCTEVLEHVRNPFTAIENVRNLLHVGGIALISTPLNFRQHGMGGYDKSQGLPPDYWRFTETGIRTLVSDFGRLQILDFKRVPSERDFFPIHFTLICRKG